MSKTIAEMTAEVRAINEEKGWRDRSNTVAEYLLLLHSEASEALEAYRDAGLDDQTAAKPWGSDPEGGLPKPEGFGSETADVLIRLLDMCDALGIDLEAEYERKVAYNRTRPYKHGGRAL